MTEPRYNIVQAEFFHTGAERSLEALQYHIMARVRDGAPIKTTVRFPDARGLVTRHVLRHERLLEHKRCCFDAFGHSSGLMRKAWATRHDFAAKRIGRHQKKAVPLCAEEFKFQSGAGDTVAVEQSDQSFLLAGRHELRNLVESAYAAKGVWIFLFEPNERLLADQKLIGSATTCL